jgi:hypothetical protein
MIAILEGVLKLRGSRPARSLAETLTVMTRARRRYGVARMGTKYPNITATSVDLQLDHLGWRPHRYVDKVGNEGVPGFLITTFEYGFPEISLSSMSAWMVSTLLFSSIFSIFGLAATEAIKDSKTERRERHLHNEDAMFALLDNVWWPGPNFHT